MILHIDVDGARSLHAGEGGHWVVAAHRSGKRALVTKFSAHKVSLAHRSGRRALVTKFSAHKVSLLDINGDKVSYSWFDLHPRFVSGAPPTAAAGARSSPNSVLTRFRYSTSTVTR
jgi:hypothetical protein